MPDEWNSKTVDSATPLTTEPITKAALDEALLALRSMARLSSRGQADLTIALDRARLRIPVERRSELLARLTELGQISDVITLSDGGVLLTVVLR